MLIFFLFVLLFLLYKFEIPNKIINQFNLSRAASKIEYYFRNSSLYTFNGDPSSEARKIVKLAWCAPHGLKQYNHMYPILSGHHGRRPQIMTIVIYSLAIYLSNHDDIKNKDMIAFALGDAIKYFYSDVLMIERLSSVDHTFVQESIRIYTDYIENKNRFQ